MNTKVLCIGGPLDGKAVPFDGARLVARNIRPVPLGPVALGQTDISEKIVAYTAQTISWGSRPGQQRIVYVAGDMPDLTDKLMARIKAMPMLYP